MYPSYAPHDSRVIPPLRSRYSYIWILLVVDAAVPHPAVSRNFELNTTPYTHQVRGSVMQLVPCTGSMEPFRGVFTISHTCDKMYMALNSA